jgi:hypothetical protein
MNIPDTVVPRKNMPFAKVRYKVGVANPSIWVGPELHNFVFFIGCGDNNAPNALILSFRIALLDGVPQATIGRDAFAMGRRRTDVVGRSAITKNLRETGRGLISEIVWREVKLLSFSVTDNEVRLEPPQRKWEDEIVLRRIKGYYASTKEHISYRAVRVDTGNRTPRSPRHLSSNDLCWFVN